MRITLLLTLVLAAPAAAGATPQLPLGFRTDHVVGEPFAGEPVGFTFLPDGRIVIVERQSGAVRLAAVDATTSELLTVIPGVEGRALERGLLGVAVDPEWPARPYLYFYYTHTDSVSHVTMVTASGDLQNPSSTALVLSDAYPLLVDITDSTGIHNGGTLRFGTDGMLYVSLGDDADACHAQDLESPLGKILRLDVAAMPGAGPGPPPKAAITPTDNPFPTAGEWGKLVWAWGLRNPFRFSVDAASGDLFVANVGWIWFEEIDLVPAAGPFGPNFGWPQLEGPRPVTEFGRCGEGREFTAPITVLPHGESVISAIAGPLYRSGSDPARRFPGNYHGDFFFLEFYSGDIYRLRRTGDTWDFAPPVAGQTGSTWASGFRWVSDFQEGPDGALYLLAFGFGELPAGLHRIVSTRMYRSEPAPDDAELRAAPNPARAGRGVELSVPSPTTGDWSVSVFDVEGRLVRTMTGSGVDVGSVRWDGRTNDGAPALAGVYVVRWETAGRTLRGKITLLP